MCYNRLVMWTTSYILSQIAVVIAVIFMAFSYQLKDKRLILIFCLLSCSFYMLEYIFLGAYGGIVVNAIGFIRIIWLYSDERYNLKDRFVIVTSMSLAIIVCTLIMYRGWQDIIICLASLIFNYSVWQKNIKIYRWLSVPVSALYITYNVFVHTIMGVVLEVILLAFEIVGIVRLYWKPKKKLEAQDIEIEN